MAGVEAGGGGGGNSRRKEDFKRRKSAGKHQDLLSHLYTQERNKNIKVKAALSVTKDAWIFKRIYTFLRT